MSFNGKNFAPQWGSKKNALKDHSVWSRTPLGNDTTLGDAEKIEEEIFERNGNFDAVKSVVHNASDQTLRILNTNIELQNYKEDPLYKYMDGLKSQSDSEKTKWPINYYHFIHGVTHKIKNRTLKGEDYNLLWNADTGKINQEVFERYKNIQSRYKKIGADVSFSSIFDNHTSNWELSGHFGKTNSTLITLSKNRGIKGALEYLEQNINQCEKMFGEGISSVDIGLYLVNSNYEKVINIKKELGEFADFKYSYINNEHIFFPGDSGRKIARGKDLQGLIDDFVSKKWLFDQKDMFKNVHLGEMEKYYSSPTQKMQYIISEYNTYCYLTDFWKGKNNAAAGFNGPSAGYGLNLMGTFQQAEYETSAAILMKLMAENGNTWTILEDKVQDVTKKNLLRCGAITIANGLVSFTKNSISIIEKKYKEQKETSLKGIKKLEDFFMDSHISLSK